MPEKKYPKVIIENPPKPWSPCTGDGCPCHHDMGDNIKTLSDLIVYKKKRINEVIESVGGVENRFLWPKNKAAEIASRVDFLMGLLAAKKIIKE